MSSTCRRRSHNEREVGRERGGIAGDRLLAGGDCLLHQRRITAIQSSRNRPSARQTSCRAWRLVAYRAPRTSDLCKVDLRGDTRNHRAGPGFIASVFRGENPVFTRREDMEHLLEGLRLAGLPE